jgi:hypothetical protein
MVKTKGKNKKKKLATKLHHEADRDDMESDDLSSSARPAMQEVYLPGDPINEDEELVREESAYEMFHEAQTGTYVTMIRPRSHYIEKQKKCLSLFVFSFFTISR